MELIKYALTLLTLLTLSSASVIRDRNEDVQLNYEIIKSTNPKVKSKIV